MTQIWNEIDRVFPIDSFPSDVLLRWDIDCTADAKSKVKFTVGVIPPAGPAKSDNFFATVEDGESDLSFEPNPLTLSTAGTYTLRVFVDGQLKWETSVSFIEGP